MQSQKQNGSKKSMTQKFRQAAIETVKAAVMVVKEAENSVNTARSVHIMPRTGCPALNQPSFNWEAAEKYQEL